MVVLGAPSSTVEQLLFPCTQAGDGTIMLLGMFSWVALGQLFLVEGTVKVVDYPIIIANMLHSYMVSIFPTENSIFQQDSILCQKARIICSKHASSSTKLAGLQTCRPKLSQICSIGDKSGERALRGKVGNVVDAVF
ncbi:hypothetical protein TNCV_1224921 [Trichonephila clavipes]|nr:hypothetical protein TNCV_1224921 [Trichonephila clavipes]